MNLLKKIFYYYIDRATEAVKYLIKLVICVGVNLAIMPSLVFITYLIMNYFGLYYEASDKLIDSYDPVIVIGLMFVVGAIEELYFRYFVMDCILIQWLKSPVWFAVAFSSITFGLAHLGNPGGWHSTLPQAVGAIGAGLWFAYIYRRWGLHLAILTHAVYNSVVTLIPLLFK